MHKGIKSMGIAVSIVSAVLKSVVGDKLGSGLIKELADISIDGISEKGINEITNFINYEKSQIEHILSRENMKSMDISEDNIDYVVSEIKNLFLWINITDEVLRKCKYDSMNLSVFLWNEYCKHKNGYVESESDIKRSLFIVAEALSGLVRKSNEFSEKMLIQISNSVDDVNVRLQKISEYMKNNSGKLDITYQAILEILKVMIEQYQKQSTQKDNRSSYDQVVMFKNDKKSDYINNWNSRLFLHVDNNERPITLADAFIMPEIKIHGCDKHFTIYYNIDFEKFISQFVQTKSGSTMLITGVPGIGKTCITSWIAQKYEKDDRVIILRFRDWESEDLGQGILKAICNTLKCKKIDLNSRILVLDGFDEIKLLGKRNYLLNEFFNDINDLINFKIIITSRPAYIKPDNFINKISLLPFGKSMIGNFYKIITGENIDKRKIDNQNLEVLGIPVILYMAIMSNVDLTKVASKPELYNIIFAEKGGIFDKFSEYDSGSQVFRNLENIKKYLLFLREIAFKMFIKNISCIPKNECQIPKLTFQGDSVSILEFPIKHLFENVKTNIEFIHNSLYEYFVAEYIYRIIDMDISREQLANYFGNMFLENVLSIEVLEFLIYKVRSSDLNNKFDVISEVFQLMLNDGMTFYTRKYYRNVIEREICVFTNMLEIIHLWKDKSYKFSSALYNYVKYCRGSNINLSNMILGIEEDISPNKMIKKANGEYVTTKDWTKIDLSYMNLSNSNLVGVDLTDANLENTKLVNAKLACANLKGARIKGIDLTGADLEGTIFDENQISYLKDKFELKKSKIYMKGMGVVVDYNGEIGFNE